MCIVFACDPHKNQQPLFPKAIFFCIDSMYERDFSKYCAAIHAFLWAQSQKKKKINLKSLDCLKYLQGEKIGMTWYRHRYTLKSWNK